MILSKDVYKNFYYNDINQEEHQILIQKRKLAILKNPTFLKIFNNYVHQILIKHQFLVIKRIKILKKNIYQKNAGIFFYEEPLNIYLPTNKIQTNSIKIKKAIKIKHNFFNFFFKA